MATVYWIFTERPGPVQVLLLDFLIIGHVSIKAQRNLVK